MAEFGVLLAGVSLADTNGAVKSKKSVYFQISIESYSESWHQRFENDGYVGKKLPSKAENISIDVL
jgi:hypothetical protein